MYFSCKRSYLLHILVEENHLLGSVGCKELINQTELQESDMSYPKTDSWRTENVLRLSSLRTRL